MTQMEFPVFITIFKQRTQGCIAGNMIIVRKPRNDACQGDFGIRIICGTESNIIKTVFRADAFQMQRLIKCSAKTL